MKTSADKAYSDILKVLKKHKDVCVFDVDNLERQANNHLFGIRLKEEYGFDINPKSINSTSYNKFGDYMTLMWMGEKHGRTVSWSDDGKNPEDELLLEISFPTGAYIFGDDYPTELFKELIQELKSYNPKYTDSHNSNLFYSMDNASKIFNEFDDIMRKYFDKNKVDFKQRKIKQMKDEIAKLENS